MRKASGGIKSKGCERMKRNNLYEIIGALVVANENGLAETLAQQISHMTPQQKMRARQRRRRNISKYRRQARIRYRKRKSRGGRPLDMKISRVLKRIAKRRR